MPAAMPARPRLAAVLLLAALLSVLGNVALGANPVQEPIRVGKREIHIKPFVTIPKSGGKQPRVNAMTYFGGDIYVVTEHAGIVYRIRNG